MKIHSMPDYTVIIGESRYDNEAVLQIALPDDVWMHLEGDSSAHAVIQTSARLNHKMLKHAARLIKSSSKYRSTTEQVPFVWTRVSNVVPTKVPGQVEIVRDERIFLF